MMQPLLGFFLFSVLLTTGASCQCEPCIPLNCKCVAQLKICPCAAALREIAEGSGSEYDNLSTNNYTPKCCYAPFILVKGRCTDTCAPCIQFECSRASPSPASCLLALSGFLLMKIII